MTADVEETKKKLSDSTVLQDAFLTAMEEQRRPMSIYLINGIKLTGTIVGYDGRTVLMHQTNGNGVLTSTQLIYLSAVSTMVPDRPFDLFSHMAGS